MKKFPSHITLGHNIKNINLQKQEKCLTPIASNKPFYYKGSNLTLGIAQSNNFSYSEKELFLKDNKKTLASPRIVDSSNSKSEKKSFRRKT